MKIKMFQSVPVAQIEHWHNVKYENDCKFKITVSVKKPISDFRK